MYFIDIFQQRSDKGALKTVKISAEDRTKCLDSQLRQDPNTLHLLYCELVTPGWGHV